MYELTYTPRYGDYKDFNTLKPGCLLDMVQDVSIRHSSELGYGLTRLRDMNIAWLMQGIKVNFCAEAETESPVTVKTAVCSMKGASSERGCILEQNGKVIAKTVANWFTFDTINQKPCRIPKEFAEIYPIHDFGDDFFSFKKIPVIESAYLKYSLRIGNKDLDTNMHLNNQKSAEILMDALPYDFKIRNMAVSYKTPAFLGEELGVCSESTDDGYYVHLINSDGEICVVGNFSS